jgi:hypothetical protein
MPSTPAPTCQKQTFSKGPPASNTRSSVARAFTSNSSPNIPPDPDDSAVSTIHHHSPSPNPTIHSLPSNQNHHSTSPSITIHQQSPTHNHQPTTPSIHNSTISSARHSLFEGRTSFEQVHAIGDHINHLKSHVESLLNDINHVTNKISNMESEFQQTNQQLVAIIDILNANIN